jgi:type IV pilus biogenesis protein CpaD/CtpE
MKSVLLALITACLASCATEPTQPLNVQNVKSVVATVKAINHEKRLATLQGPGGRSVTVQVPPEVRNLAQVKVGDQVTVKYVESFVANMAPKGSSIPAGTVTTDVARVRAQEGAKPGAAVGAQVHIVVKIQAVDTKTQTVAFIGADGMARELTAQDPRSQAFIAQLKAGDEVDVVYTEALAVSVDTVK